MIKTFGSEDNHLRLICVVCGLVIGCFSIYATEIIARDGIRYIQAAQAFNIDGFYVSFTSYPWPFYPIAISFIHSLTGVSFENAAHVFNTILLLILADSFIRLYWEVHPGSKLRWVPVAVILAYTGINDYRPEIIRDWGFWSFSLLAFYYVLRAQRTHSQKDFLLWQVFIGVAFLFRIEAFVFIVMIPIWFLWSDGNWKSRLIKPCQSVSLYIIISLGCIGLSFALGGWEFIKLDKANHFFAYLNIEQTFQYIFKRSNWIAEKVFPRRGDQYAVLFMMSGLFGILLFGVLKKLGYGYLLILLSGAFKIKRRLYPSMIVFIGYLLCLSFFIVYGHFSKTMIIAGRYVILTTLLLLILVSFYVEQLLSYCALNNKVWLVHSIKAMFIINLLFGLIHSGNPKLYMKEMGVWVSENISDSSKIITNEPRLAYYSGRQFSFNRPINTDWVGSRKLTNSFKRRIEGFDYLLVTIDENFTSDIIKQMGITEIHRVTGDSGNSAVLYKVVIN